MPRNAHEHRPAARPGAARRRASPAEPAADYVPGFFTALVHRHNWPPRWQSAMPEPDHRQAAAVRAGQVARRVGNETGLGWGNGTLALPGTPGTLPPGALRRAS